MPKPPRRAEAAEVASKKAQDLYLAAEDAKAAADAAAAKAKEAQAAAAAAKAEADAAQKIVDELKAKGEKEIDNGTGVGGEVIIGEHTDDGSGVTKVDETTAVVNKTGVKLVGYYNNKGAFDVVDYYVTDADGDPALAGSLPPVDLALGDTASSSTSGSSNSNLPAVLIGVGVVGAAAAAATTVVVRRKRHDGPGNTSA